MYQQHAFARYSFFFVEKNGASVKTFSEGKNGNMPRGHDFDFACRTNRKVLSRKIGLKFLRKYAASPDLGILVEVGFPGIEKMFLCK